MDVEQRARDALNAVFGVAQWGQRHTRAASSNVEAVCRLIEQHDAFKREVSDAVKGWFGRERVPETLASFILEKPAFERAKHIASAIDYATAEWTLVTDELKAARLEEILARHGLTITKEPS